MSNAPVAKAKSRFLMTYSSLFLLGPTLQPSRCCARRKISKLLEPGCFFVLAPSFPLGTGGTFAMEPVKSELSESDPGPGRMGRVECPREHMRLRMRSL